MYKTELNTTLSMFRPDVIHIATPSSLGFFALNYAKKHGIPVLSVYHTHFISYIKYYLKNLPFLINFTESIIARTYRKFYNKCDVTMFPRGRLPVSWNRVECRLRTLSYGNEVSIPPYFRLKRGIGHSYKNDRNDYPTLLFVSRLVWEKIWRRCSRFQPGTGTGFESKFLVAGDGVAEKVARSRMKKAFFLGFLKHKPLAKVYASSDIFVFPSISEAYGNVVIEAMASGCVPVIARGGGSQALVEDGVTGFLCEPNEADEYIDKIKKLLNNHFLRKRMQAEGLKFTSTLSWESLSKEYFDDIENLANYSYDLKRKESV